MADSTTGGLPAVQEAAIGDLPAIVDLYDDTKIPVEQQGEARHMTGAQWKKYAQVGVEAYVTSAQQASEKALEAASNALTAVNGIGTAAEDSKANAEAAENARAAIENMLVEAISLETGQPAVSKELVDGVVKLVFGLPAGKQGDKGDPGSSIQSITRTAGTGAPGTTDTYTITLTDGSTTEFYVYNGKDGTGAGDMSASVYDPQGKNTDVFKYVDDALNGKQDTPTGTQGQVIGFDADGKLVAQDAPNGVPAGGAAEQVLSKASDADGDVEWKDPPVEIFVAAYGTTTYTEIKDSYNAGKAVFVNFEISGRSGRLPLVTLDSEQILFSGVLAKTGKYIVITCSLIGSWSYAEDILEQTSNKVTVISSESTNDQYPCAKAVYDALQVAVPANAVKIATGSYEGSGTYGKDNARRITFDFAPKVIFVSPPNGLTKFMILLRDVPYFPLVGNNTFAVLVSWGDNYVEWYGSSGVEDQLEASGTTYYYFALG